jgi:Flp pilus assembly protein TadB
MNRLLIPLSVRAHRSALGVGAKLRRTWHERADETGLDEAVTKMIWLAVGIGVAVAATAFFITVFDTAQANVPDPVAPTP